MPTQRFFNLKEEKRKAILDAAVCEFTRVPLSEVSINKIIKNDLIIKKINIVFYNFRCYDFFLCYINWHNIGIRNCIFLTLGCSWFNL